MRDGRQVVATSVLRVFGDELSKKKDVIKNLEDTEGVFQYHGLPIKKFFLYKK